MFSFEVVLLNQNQIIILNLVGFKTCAKKYHMFCKAFINIEKADLKISWQNNPRFVLARVEEATEASSCYIINNYIICSFSFQRILTF